MSTLGRFVWYELITSDVSAATEFYKAVVGWDIKDSEMTGVEYSILWMKGERVGGLMKMAGMPPHWIGYVAVPDVDEYADRVTSAGGKVLRPATDIPNIGRFAVVADPAGVAFVLFKGDGEEPAVPALNEPGTMGWHELHGGDPDASFAFYSGLFGWTKTNEMDMGPMGKYLLFGINGVEAGGMMLKTPQMPVATWMYYINVPGADAAAEAITKAGGQVLMGPHEVPGGQWIVQGLDPQGAMLALVATVR